MDTTRPTTHAGPIVTISGQVVWPTAAASSAADQARAAIVPPAAAPRQPNIKTSWIEIPEAEAALSSTRRAVAVSLLLAALIVLGIFFRMRHNHQAAS
jgi:hypothetical protein